MATILDTSILIAGWRPQEDEEFAISVCSIAELHVGVLRAVEPEARALRLQRVAAIESAFDPFQPTTLSPAHMPSVPMRSCERAGTRDHDHSICSSRRLRGFIRRCCTRSTQMTSAASSHSSTSGCRSLDSWRGVRPMRWPSDRWVGFGWLWP